MLRRVPPVLLALAATVVVLLVGAAVFVGLGRGQQSTLPSCGPALAQGPYGCVVFVSVSGSVDGTAAQEPEGGAITYRIERQAGGLQLIWAGDCNGGEGSVSVSATQYRLGAMLSGQKACAGSDGSLDAWGGRLFQGTLAVTERDDATVELVRGGRRAVFAETVVPRS